MKEKRKLNIIRSAIIAGVLHLSLFSAFASNIFLHYSSDEPRIKELTIGVSERPSDQSLTVAHNVIGRWTAMPIVSKSLDQNPEVTWQSISFNTNGRVEISYKLANQGGLQNFVGTYEVIHKATVARGNPPHIVVRSTIAQDNNLNMLMNVRVGEFSYFPPDVPVLWFQDLDGYHYVFESVDVSSEEMFKRLGRISAVEQKIAEQREREKCALKNRRVTDAELTRQIVDNLQSGTLTDQERNKEILRLMNAGDETSVPVLLEHLKADHSLVVRQNTIRALGKIGDKRAVPPLLDILRAPVQGRIEDEGESEALFRREAVLALDDIGDPSSLAVLRTIAEAAREYQSVRDFARIAMRKLKGQ